MVEQIKYINHINETMLWGENGIYVNNSDLHDYSWDYLTDNNKISNFNMGIVKKTVPIIIACNSATDGILLKNQLLEYAEKDVLASTHGKIVIGDYYLKCFITGSKKSNYQVSKGYLQTSLTIASDYPQWIKESTISFRTDGTVVTEDSTQTSVKSNLDFAFDFPFDYTSEMRVKTLNNTSFIGVNFKLIIFGAVTNPSIFIAGHEYSVDCEVASGEYLTIDSTSKTIYLTKINGDTENCFNSRNRQSYIFEKIPVGDNKVTWDGTFGFDVILMEERSEPKWT